MDKEKVLRIAPYALLITMGVLTILFYRDIKFVVGLSIIGWDMVAIGIWIFVCLCKWANRKNAVRRLLVVAAVTLVGALTLVIVIFGKLPHYIEGTEPHTRRTFVVEYTQNMMNRGSAKLYERFGPLLFACDVDEYVGEISNVDTRWVYLSEDGEAIVVAFFFVEPVFVVPLE